MCNILQFPPKKVFINGVSDGGDVDDVLRSMAVVTQQLELMLDVLRERARLEAQPAAGLEKAAEA
ncbi:hypothetical protein [Shinella granuli]|uniref:Uncharacterized protein n=1 Tax=Shinella granuli TaxID=323621 RepID=A0A4R2CBZ4_SHIGR|nr:hypothetical protein [Shinella granuli]TCN37132.1 hypothetical protein EV665_123101 [Shinella granuli]